MASDAPHYDEERCREQLQDLRDSPAGLDDVSQQTLSEIYSYVMGAPTVGGGHHWYCAKASPVVTEGATFILRLYAYDSGHVAVWKARLSEVLHTCCDCTQAYQAAKWVSRSTYFGTFGDSILDEFFDSLSRWEAETVLTSLRGVRLPAATHSRLTLGALPPALIYHPMANPKLLANTELVEALASFCPSGRILGWPVESPPGLFVMLVHPSQDVRSWARIQVSGSPELTESAFNDDHKAVVAALVGALNKGDTRGAALPGPSGPWDSFITMSTEALWCGFLTILQSLPLAALKMKMKLNTSSRLCHVILSHVHDSGSHFSSILRCFVVLLQRLKGDLWTDEGADYPVLVLAAIKDNAAFLALLETCDDTLPEQWFLEWFSPFLQSIRSKPTYGDALANLVGFMCEELQHERFKRWHAITIESIARTLLATLKDFSDQEIVQAVRTPFDIHSKVFVEVALSVMRFPATWARARAASQALLNHMLAIEARSVCATARELTVWSQRRVEANFTMPKSITLPSFRRSLWELTFSAVRDAGAEGITFIAPCVAPSCLIAPLATTSYLTTHVPASLSLSFRSSLGAANKALAVIHSGVEGGLNDFVNLSSPAALNSLCNQPNFIYSVVGLLFSPVDAVQSAAKALVSQAFGVDGTRGDCFRGLLEQKTEATLTAVIKVVGDFTQLGKDLIEACSLSKTLVLCLTDVLEILCTRGEGLLFDASYTHPPDGTRPTKLLPKLWTNMSAALALIFKRTPAWSAFYESGLMVDWMRDALIFGRDMLAYRSVFESASLAADTDEAAAVSASPRKLSRVGTRMVEALQTVLMEVLNWLRLTDEELLHQSLSLLRSLFECFRQTGVQPAPESLTRLERLLEKAQEKAKSKDSTTRLSAVDLADLRAEMAHFDDDVQIVESPSVMQPVWKPVPPAPRMATAPADADDIVFLGRSGKPVPTPLSRPPPNVTKQPLPKLSQRPGGQTSSLIKEARKAAAKAQPPRRPEVVLPSRSTVSAPAARPTLVTSSSSSTACPRIQRFSAAAQAIRNEAQGHQSRASSSSEDEKDDSDEEEDEEGNGDSSKTGLAGLVKFQKSPKVKRREERRAIKLITITNAAQVAVDKRKAERKAEANSLARLKPDLSPLHRKILTWNYDHPEAEPPWNGKRPTLTPVPHDFASPEEYLRIFEPLLSLECWTSLIKSKEDSSIASLMCKITSRQTVDEWSDLDIAISETLPPKWSLGDNDVVLLRHPAHGKCALAKVHSVNQSNRALKQMQVTLRCLFTGHHIDPGLQISTTWKLSKVFSLATVNREYAALVALQYYDLLHDVLRPQPRKAPTFSSMAVRQAMKAHQVNEPQASAILASLATDGFLLIQGPPGTGKTSTICGLVGACISSRPKPVTEVQKPGKGGGSPAKSHSKKILICAPSNAGIDEVAKRLKDGVRDSAGNRFVPSVVRVGADATINISVKDISLDYLVDQRANATADTHRIGESKADDVGSIRIEMISVKQQLETKYAEATAVHDNASKSAAIQKEINVLKSKRMALSQRFDRAKDKQKADTRALDAARRKFRHDVLMEADVICSTLSGAGHEALSQLDFEMVIIDEAAQSIELSSLIPLKYKCRRCILVGDPQQLPPTVLSPVATKLAYNQSLFVRIHQRSPEAVCLLSIQYRMHPDISKLPSMLFYEGRVVDGPDMASKTHQPWHGSALLGTYNFFNVAKGREDQAHSGHSLINRAECDSALALYECFLREYRDIDMNYRVGVITMYRAQLLALKLAFENRHGPAIVGKIDFNTVDGFQGQEKDVIILSCVRAGPGVQSVGFLADYRRLNVAITRSRSSLFILGNAATLERSDPMWRQIVHDARTRSRFIDVRQHGRSVQLTAIQVDTSTFKRALEPSTVKAAGAKAKIAQPVVAVAPLPELFTPQKFTENVKRRVPSPDLPINGFATSSKLPVVPSKRLSSKRSMESVTVPTMPAPKRHKSNSQQSVTPQPLAASSGGVLPVVFTPPAEPGGASSSAEGKDKELVLPGVLAPTAPVSTTDARRNGNSERPPKIAQPPRPKKPPPALFIPKPPKIKRPAQD